MKARYPEICSLVKEHPILTDAGFLEAIDATSEEFGAFRSTCFTIADGFRSLAGEYARLLCINRDDSDAWKEYLGWRNVTVKSNFLVALIHQLSGLSFKKIDRIMPLFSVSHSRNRENAALDGFTPPFWWLGETTVMFSPDILILMLSARNIPFALSKLDKRCFDERVSKHLEPALIAETIDVLKCFNLQILTGIAWSGFEFDLLVYEPVSNTVVHFQAKAAIPAQGARLVSAVEARSREGLKQLQVFREFPLEERRKAMVHFFGQIACDAEVIDVLLTRGGIGSWRVWDELGPVVPANPALLRAAIRDSNMSLRDLVLSLTNVLDEICETAYNGWAQTPTCLFESHFEIPILDLNQDIIFELRANRVAN